MKATSTFILFLFSTIFSFSQTKSAIPDKTKPFILGVIDELQSTQLGEKRILNIYLPEGYNKNDSVKYPVIYLLDGSADEDFIHVVGLVQFNSFEWVNRVPKSIVVGIANVDRKRDFTYPTQLIADQKRYPATGHSDKFISFIEKELEPFIEKKYKGTGSRTIIGESLGGLLATEILFSKPKMFDKYIIISPSLWWDDASLLKRSPELLNENYTHQTDVYIGYGKEGLAPGDIPHVMEIDANLLAEKIKSSKSKNVNVQLDYLPDEDHATIGHHAVFDAFRMLFPVKK